MAGAKSNKTLTTKTIEAMKPGSPVLTDTEENRGLRVSCGSTGKKTFTYRYKSPATQKLKSIKIGNFPDISLSQARQKLQELKKLRAEGVCPSEEEKRRVAVIREQTLERVESTFTVEDMVELYLTEYIEDRHGKDGKIIAGSRKPKGQAETRRTLHSDVVRTLGKKAAEAVTRQNVIDLVKEIVDRGANVQAGNVLRELSAAYEYALGLGRLSQEFVNPAVLAKASLKQAKIRLSSERGKRVLTDGELKKLIEWLPGSHFTATITGILRLTLWTGCRTGEVCVAEWDNIDLNKGTFHIRESKTDIERHVQLPRQAVEFLKGLQHTTGRYLFASQKTKLPLQQKQLTEQAWRLRQDGRMLDIPHWTPHDLRRTVRTGLARLKCPSEVGEAILGHSRSGIEGTYDLHRYEDECREWLQRWADYMDSL